MFYPLGVLSWTKYFFFQKPFCSFVIFLQDSSTLTLNHDIFNVPFLFIFGIIIQLQHFFLTFLPTKTPIYPPYYPPNLWPLFSLIVIAHMYAYMCAYYIYLHINICTYILKYHLLSTDNTCTYVFRTDHLVVDHQVVCLHVVLCVGLKLHGIFFCAVWHVCWCPPSLSHVWVDLGSYRFPDPKLSMTFCLLE